MGQADTTGCSPDAIKTESENFASPIPIQESPTWVGLMSCSACHTLPLVVFLAFLVPLRWVAQNLRTQRFSNSVNLYQQQLVFDSFLLAFVFDFHKHTVINSVQVHILPTVQLPSALTDSFSWGHDPFTHACKARPLTIVGSPCHATGCSCVGRDLVALRRPCKELIVRMMHFSGRSRCIFHEGVTLLDLREKVRISAFDTNGLTPTSVGLGHVSVIFLCNTVTPAPTPADGSHDVADVTSPVSRRPFLHLRSFVTPPRSKTLLPAQEEFRGHG